MENKRENYFLNISLKTLVAILLFIIALIVFSLLAHEVVFENEDWFDTEVFNFFNENSSPASIQIFKFLSFFGSTFFLLPAYTVLIAWLLYTRRRKDAIDVGIIGATSTLLMHGLKFLFDRSRPELPLFRALTNNSFPSGHALLSFIFCSVLIWLLWNTNLSKKWKWVLLVLLILFSFAIGISRIVLRYHYASDVLAGFCLGFAWVLLFFWIRKKIRRG